MVDKKNKAASSIPLSLEGNLNFSPHSLSTQKSAFTEIPYSEGFRFSFNDPIIENHDKSFESTQSPTKPLENSTSKSKSVIQELNFLQTQIKEINCRVSQNLKTLQEKQDYNKKLKSLILKYEQKPTFTNDISFTERKCLCSEDCHIL